MNQDKQLSPLPFIIIGFFMIGGIFADTATGFPMWEHRLFDVLWIGFWGSLLIGWLAYETRVRRPSDEGKS